MFDEDGKLVFSKNSQLRLVLSIFSGRRDVKDLTYQEKALLNDPFYPSLYRDTSQQPEYYLKQCEDILFDLLSEEPDDLRSIDDGE